MRGVKGPSRCGFEGCENPHYAKGLCDGHYQQAFKRGEDLAPLQTWTHGEAECSRPGCSVRRKSQEYCGKHYSRASKYTSALGVSAKEVWDLVDDLMEEQGGVCPICKEPVTLGGSSHIDHSHVTGQLRGVLCPLGNQGLGQFRDRADFLTAAVSYLYLNEVSG